MPTTKTPKDIKQPNSSDPVEREGEANKKSQQISRGGDDAARKGGMTVERDRPFSGKDGS